MSIFVRLDSYFTSPTNDTRLPCNPISNSKVMREARRVTRVVSLMFCKFILVLKSLKRAFVDVLMLLLLRMFTVKPLNIKFNREIFFTLGNNKKGAHLCLKSRRHRWREKTEFDWSYLVCHKNQHLLSTRGTACTTSMLQKSLNSLIPLYLNRNFYSLIPKCLWRSEREKNVKNERVREVVARGRFKCYMEKKGCENWNCFHPRSLLLTQNFFLSCTIYIQTCSFSLYLQRVTRNIEWGWVYTEDEDCLVWIELAKWFLKIVGVP